MLYFGEIMFQPLDYLFLIMILIIASYGAFNFWYNFMRVNTKTKDDLIERYVELERYEDR